MSERVGPVALAVPGLFLQGDGRHPEPLSPQLADIVDTEVKRLLHGAEGRANEVLARRRERLDRLAELLLEREVLEGSELRKAIAQVERGVTQAHTAAAGHR